MKAGIKKPSLVFSFSSQHGRGAAVAHHQTAAPVGVPAAPGHRRPIWYTGNGLGDKPSASMSPKLQTTSDHPWEHGSSCARPAQIHKRHNDCFCCCMMDETTCRAERWVCSQPSSCVLGNHNYISIQCYFIQ